MSYSKKSFWSKPAGVLICDDEKFIKYWDRWRSKGRNLYIAGYTIFMAFGFTIAGIIISNLKGNFLGWEKGKEAMLASIITGLVTGFVSSATGWAMNESRYKKIKSNSHGEQ